MVVACSTPVTVVPFFTVFFESPLLLLLFLTFPDTFSVDHPLLYRMVWRRLSDARDQSFFVPGARFRDQ